MKSIKNIEKYIASINTSKPDLLDFYADWCGPCRTLLPTVETLAEKHKDDFVIAKLNVNEIQDYSN